MHEYIECIPQLNTIISALAPNESEWILVTRERVLFSTPGVYSCIGISKDSKPESHPWFREIFSGTPRISMKISGWRGDSSGITEVTGVGLTNNSGEVKGAFFYLTSDKYHSHAENLLSTIQEMTQEENLSTALDIFTRKTRELFECTLVGIYLQDEGKFSLVSVNALQKEYLNFLSNQEFPGDYGIDCVGIEANKDVEFKPLLLHLNRINEEWVHPFKKAGMSSLVCMPLTHFGQTLGVVVLFSGLEQNYIEEKYLMEEEPYTSLKQVIPVVSSFVYEQKLRLASIDREQALTLLLRGTEILIQANSEEQLLTEAGEMAMEILFLPGGFFLLANQEGQWEIRAPFGRLKQTDWDWQAWVKHYTPQSYDENSNDQTEVHFLEIEDNPFHWENVLIQPLQTHSGIVGELWLMNAKEHATEHRQEILAAFVRGVGVALETIWQRDELARLANTDRLTGIMNRQGFEQRIREEMAGTLRRESTFLLLVLDLDLFKQINDTHGHPVGDVVLKSIAQNLRSAVREQDIVARTGGDEFTVVLTDIKSGDEAMVVIERMKKSMRLEEYELGVSIGVAEFPTEGRDFEELYRLADQRLYQGKNTGKGRIILN